MKKEHTLKNNKKIFIIIIVVILLLGVFLLVRGCSNKQEKTNGLKISYGKGEIISFNKFNRSFEVKRVITIENISKENKTYSLEWSEIKNGLKKQNKFLYEITCTGSRCATLGKSQVPVVDTVVFPQVLIEPGIKQKYTIVFSYDGSEKGAKFNGILKVNKSKL